MGATFRVVAFASGYLRIALHNEHLSVPVDLKPSIPTFPPAVGDCGTIGARPNDLTISILRLKAQNRRAWYLTTQDLTLAYPA